MLYNHIFIILYAEILKNTTEITKLYGVQCTSITFLCMCWGIGRAKRKNMDWISQDGEPSGALIHFAKPFTPAIYVKCFLCSVKMFLCKS